MKSYLSSTPICTDEKILIDLRHRARHHYSIKDDKTQSTLGILGFAATIVVGLLTHSAWCLLCFLFPLGYIGIEAIIDIKKAKEITFSDFSVTTDKLSSVQNDYVKTGPSDYLRCVICYFESGAQWEASFVNYKWSNLYKMTRKGVYNTSLQGDTFYLVWDNRTKELVLAYNAKLFAYKKS